MSTGCYKRMDEADGKAVPITEEEFYEMLEVLPPVYLCDPYLTVNAGTDETGRMAGTRSIKMSFAVSECVRSEKDGNVYHCGFMVHDEKQPYWGKIAYIQEVIDRTSKKVLAHGTPDGIFMWSHKRSSQSFDWQSRHDFELKNFTA